MKNLLNVQDDSDQRYTTQSSRVTLLKLKPSSHLLHIYTHTHTRKYILRGTKIRPHTLVSFQAFRNSSFSERYNSLAVKVLLKIKVQSCAKRFSLWRQKLPSTKILQVYLEQFSLCFLKAEVL